MLLREVGVAASVPIEPEKQSVLIDATMQVLYLICFSIELVMWRLKNWNGFLVWRSLVQCRSFPTSSRAECPVRLLAAAACCLASYMRFYIQSMIMLIVLVGAGGYDALFCIVLQDGMQGVVDLWEGWQELQVCPLPIEVDHRGVVVETS